MAKVVVITGASRGIGAATARLAAAQGWDVCVNYNRNVDAAQSVADDVRAAGQRALVVQANISDANAIRGMFDASQEQLGPLNSFVNNAGITGRAGPYTEVTDETLREITDVNIFGCLVAAREAATRMVKSRGGPGGTIVNVSSAASTLGSPNEFVWYAASKGAMDSLTIGLAQELGVDGVRVNAVNPGLIETDIHDAAGIENRLEKLQGNVPLRRPGTAHEVAESIVWLMSDVSSYVSGTCLRVAGGR